MALDLTMPMIFADICGAQSYLNNVIENNEFTNKQKKYLKNQAGYHLQQACEKLIKIQIYKSKKPFDNSKLYRHNLVQLVEYAESLNIEIIIPSYIKEDMELITSWEAEGRYSVTKVIRIDRLNNTFKEVKEWYLFLLNKGYK